jgi:hypothetical protein
VEQKEAQRKLKTQIILCCTAALFLAVAIRACSFNIEPDYFWHVKLGEWLIQNRQMMGADVFSWTAGEHIITEFAHSWLGSIILYVFHAVGTALFNYQYLGAFIYELLMFAILTGVLLYSVKDELPGLGRDIMTSALLAIVPILAMVPLSPRPQMMGYILFAWMLAVLRSWDRGKSVLGVYWLPVISILWANIHGGTAPMLLVFCVLYLITGCMSFSSGQVRCWKKPERSLKHLTAATSISLAAMLVNPYGYKLLTYFIVGNNAACKEGVQEWQPTTIYSGLGFYLIVVAVILIVFSRYKRYSMTSLVPVAVTSGLALLYKEKYINTSILGQNVYEDGKYGPTYVQKKQVAVKLPYLLVEY